LIRMRGHHLICLHFYQGRGYNKEFVENLEDVLHRAVKGESADDICRACPMLLGNLEKKCVAKPGADVKNKKRDAEAVVHLGVEVGSKVLWQEIKTKVIATSKEWLAVFCEGCDWEKVCAQARK